MSCWGSFLLSEKFEKVTKELFISQLPWQPVIPSSQSMSILGPPQREAENTIPSFIWVPIFLRYSPLSQTLKSKVLLPWCSQLFMLFMFMPLSAPELWEMVKGFEVLILHLSSGQ